MTQKIPILKQIMAINEQEALKQWEEEVYASFTNSNDGSYVSPTTKTGSNAQGSVVLGPNSSTSSSSPEN